ncbi:unnamed protein product [Notodromas monacha]|uniref:Uncharacterized protein n=1 Tax=Notodromas monacha TaxID=399045 RepID=A0A7R9BR64_9CRUS|nr:unnamed protein product [Notodromas monacha]CAG0918814.1 unnamed protein product [Notodromas monacha]
MVRALSQDGEVGTRMTAESRRADFLMMGGDVSLVEDNMSDDISELDKNSINLPEGKEEPRRPSGMAPTTTIETVTIVRPLKPEHGTPGNHPRKGGRAGKGEDSWSCRVDEPERLSVTLSSRPPAPGLERESPLSQGFDPVTRSV